MLKIWSMVAVCNLQGLRYLFLTNKNKPQNWRIIFQKKMLIIEYLLNSPGATFDRHKINKARLKIYRAG